MVEHACSPPALPGEADAAISHSRIFAHFSDSAYFGPECRSRVKRVIPVAGSQAYEASSLAFVASRLYGDRSSGRESRIPSAASCAKQRNKGGLRR